MRKHFLNVDKIEKTVKDGSGFDRVLVVSSDKNQADFWRKRLNKFKNKIIGKNAKIFSQYEDWPGGAGQLFGTLNAFQKANQGGILEKAMEKGESVAIYHTAGKGKRIAPLTFSEGGNKPAIRLPRILEKNELLTILETVIFQTQVFAESRTGRLCVFWGDQVVIPSEDFDFEGESQVEIFGIRKEIPSQQKVWDKEWRHYGILAIDGKMEVSQREKISWEEFKGIKKTLKIEKISKSLGFFSISLPFLRALLDEFKSELKDKNKKLDTDFHLWMPLTSSKAEFVKRGGDEGYWERINDFKERFLNQERKSLALIRDKNLGEKAFWWDFGQVALYRKNLLKILKKSIEGKIMRKFFGLQTEKKSLLLNSEVGGRVKNSIIINSRAKNLKVEKAVIINSDVGRLFGKNILVYNIKDSGQLNLNYGKVVCDVFVKKKKRVRMQTRLNRDGKEDWEKKVLNNPYSYKDLESYYDEQKGLN